MRKRKRKHPGGIPELERTIQTLRDEIIRLRGGVSHKRAESKTIIALRGIEHPLEMKLSEAESLLVKGAVARDFKIFRNGWPDFLLVSRKTGEYRFIEVKSPTDKVSELQIKLFTALEGIGIHVEVFQSGAVAGMRCVPWRVAANLLLDKPGPVK